MMRIVKCEKIFLSQNEADTWKKFEQILKEIERESNNSDVLYHIGEMILHMSDLWEEIEDID